MADPVDQAGDVPRRRAVDADRLYAVASVEERCRVPAVSSTPHALRAGVRLLGLDGRAPGFGTLLSQA